MSTGGGETPEQGLTIPEWIGEEWAVLPSVVTNAMGATFRNFHYLQDVVGKLLTSSSAVRSSIDDIGSGLGAFQMQTVERLSALEGRQRSIEFALEELRSAVNKQEHDLKAVEEDVLQRLDAHFDRTKTLITTSLMSGDFISQVFSSPALVSRLVSDPAFQNYMKEGVLSRLDACEEKLAAQTGLNELYSSNLSSQAGETTSLSQQLDAMKASQQAMKMELQKFEEIRNQMDDLSSAETALRLSLDEFITKTHPDALQEVQEKCFSLITQASRRRSGNCRPGVLGDGGSLTPRGEDSQAYLDHREFTTFRNDVLHRLASLESLSEQLAALDLRTRSLESFRQGDFKESLRKLSDAQESFRAETLEKHERQDVSLKEIASQAELYKGSILAKMQLMEAKMLTTMDGRDNLFARALDLELISDNARDLGMRVRALEAAVKRLGRRDIEVADPMPHSEALPSTFSARIEYTGEKSQRPIKSVPSGSRGSRKPVGESQTRPIPCTPVRIQTTPQSAIHDPRLLKSATLSTRGERTPQPRFPSRQTVTKGTDSSLSSPQLCNGGRNHTQGDHVNKSTSDAHDGTMTTTLQSPAICSLAIRSLVAGGPDGEAQTVYYDQL